MNLSSSFSSSQEKITYQAAFRGKTAQIFLDETSQGKVIGVTSRGVFFQTSPQRVLFLSKEEFRGPLTINFLSFEPSSIQVGEAGAVTAEGKILFEHGVELILQNASLWSANPPGGINGSPETLRTRLKQCARLVLVEKRGAGLSALLNPLLGLGIPVETPDIAAQSLALIQSAQEEIRAGRYGHLPALLGSLMGRGFGLTPSGDDLILGMLLAFNRFKDLFPPVGQIAACNQAIAQLAYARTTTLSANLIEAAATGQADERLITALDGLVTGKIEPEASAALLEAWGNSSGVDALVGFSMALISIIPSSRSPA